MSSLAPRARRVRANGLDHRVLEWAPEPGACPAPAARTAVLVHGFMDSGSTWDRVAPPLAARGVRVLAPDMRGFGDSARVPAGSYYHFADYVSDLADLVDSLSPDEPVTLVGHSMGGTITTLYAGTFPERVVRLVNLEGLGPPDTPVEAGPAKMRRWVEEVRAVRARGEAAPLLREEARRLLVGNHPGVPPGVLGDRLSSLVREVVGPGGAARVTWRTDSLHRTTSPTPFFAKLFIEFAKRVTCPVLFVSGGATGLRPPDEEERLAAFPRLERATLEGAGHMLHWTQPAELVALLTACS